MYEEKIQQFMNLYTAIIKGISRVVSATLSVLSGVLIFIVAGLVVALLLRTVTVEQLAFFSATHKLYMLSSLSSSYKL